MILDTNALSAFLDGDPHAQSAIRSARVFAIPVIVAGEYFYGIARSRHRNSYERLLGDLLEDVTVLDVNLETAREYSEIRGELSAAGKPIPANDLWIAALCRQHSMPLLSRDHHFDVVPRLKRTSW